MCVLKGSLFGPVRDRLFHYRLSNAASLRGTYPSPGRFHHPSFNLLRAYLEAPAGFSNHISVDNGNENIAMDGRGACYFGLQ
jgi:hypothetical protein